MQQQKHETRFSHKCGGSTMIQEGLQQQTLLNSNAMLNAWTTYMAQSDCRQPGPVAGAAPCSTHIATAVRPLRTDRRGEQLLQLHATGSNTSMLLQGSEPCGWSVPVLPPMTYSRPPMHATLQLDRSCCQGRGWRRAGEQGRCVSRTAATCVLKLQHW
jgi:hypothetical protein